MQIDTSTKSSMEEHILPYGGLLGYDRFVLMHNNACAHLAGTVSQYLKEVELASFDC